MNALLFIALELACMKHNLLTTPVEIVDRKCLMTMLDCIAAKDVYAAMGEKKATEIVAACVQEKK